MCLSHHNTPGIEIACELSLYDYRSITSAAAVYIRPKATLLTFFKLEIDSFSPEEL